LQSLPSLPPRPRERGPEAEETGATSGAGLTNAAGRAPAVGDPPTVRSLRVVTARRFPKWRWQMKTRPQPRRSNPTS